MAHMTCMEYLSVVTEQTSIAIKATSGTVEELNNIDNTFQLRSIAYSLAVIADKLSEETVTKDVEERRRNEDES